MRSARRVGEASEIYQWRINHPPLHITHGEAIALCEKRATRDGNHIHSTWVIDFFYTYPAANPYQKANRLKSLIKIYPAHFLQLINEVHVST